MFFSLSILCIFFFFFFQAEDGIRDYKVTGVQTCALPISLPPCALPGPGFDRLHSVMPYDTTLVADRHLLDGVARGEADALRALHQRYGESIYALVYGVLVDPGEAEEVVAETFAHLWRTAARFVATTNQSVSACLKEIARSRARGLLLAREWPERPSLPPRQGPLITMIEEVV